MKGCFFAHLVFLSKCLQRRQIRRRRKAWLLVPAILCLISCEAVAGFGEVTVATAAEGFWAKLAEAGAPAYAIIVCGIFLSQALLWLVLIALYPRVPAIQSLIFGNTGFRQILGFPYITHLLVSVPCLRRRLFLPYDNKLVPKEESRIYKPDSYYDKVNVKKKQDTPTKAMRLAELICPLQDSYVIEGERGAGKTMILAHLATTAYHERRPVVLLRASECAKNAVDRAIQKRLSSEIRDEKFLRRLIRVGAMDILIDNLHEVAPDRRDSICEFLDTSFNGRFVLTLSPVASKLSSRTAQTFEIQPLHVDSIADFLGKQWAIVQQEATLSEDGYQKSIDRFLTAVRQSKSAGSKVAEETLNRLGYPFYASFAAALLAQGEEPQVARLCEHIVSLAESHYKKKTGSDFPSAEFAESLYAWRKSGQPGIGATEFEKVLRFLVDRRLMYAHCDGECVPHWYFTNDTIRDFFMLPAFLEEQHTVRRMAERGNRAFAGVYLWLRQYLNEEKYNAIFRNDKNANRTVYGKLINSPEPRTQDLQKIEYDVFLCYNRLDMEKVLEIRRKLSECNVHTWIDEDEVPPGGSWTVVESVIASVPSVAIFVGENGIGPSQKIEIEIIKFESSRRDIKIIPVMLPGYLIEYKPDINPAFVQADLRSWPSQNALDNLIWGITGTKPQQPDGGF